MTTDTDTQPATGTPGPDPRTLRVHLVVAETMDTFTPWATHSMLAYARALTKGTIERIPDPERQWMRLPDAIGVKRRGYIPDRRGTAKVGPWEWECGILLVHALAAGDVYATEDNPGGYAPARWLVYEDTLAEAGVTVEEVRAAVAGMADAAATLVAIAGRPDPLHDLRHEVWLLDRGRSS